MEGGKSKLESWSATLGAGGRGVMRAAGIGLNFTKNIAALSLRFLLIIKNRYLDGVLKIPLKRNDLIFSFRIVVTLF